MAAILRRRETQVGILGICGLLVLIPYFVVNTQTAAVQNYALSVGSILMAFTVAYGTIRAYTYHIGQLSKRVAHDWYWSIWFLVMLTIYIFTGVVLGTNSSAYSFLYNSVFEPGSSTMFSFLAFYIFSATFRTITTKNKETSIMLIVIALVVMRNAPIFSAYIPGLDAVTSWIINVLSTASSRAFTIAGGIGAVILAFRIYLGREKGLLRIGEAAKT